MRVGSAFAGIGAFDLGFARAGMDTVWFIERDPFCRRVLAKHWPGVRQYVDIRDVHGPLACPDGGCVDCLRPVDLLCGGFPCQDLSPAGTRVGLSGARSGLWTELDRLVGELRPGWVVMENVPALRTSGLGRILGALADRGYDAEWDCISAGAFGAPHVRDRIWIVGYLADAEREGLEGLGSQSGQPQDPQSRDGSQPLADSPGLGRRQGDQLGEGGPADPGGRSPESDVRRMAHGPSPGLDEGVNPWSAGEWPDVPRVVTGRVPDRPARVRALGNSLVPQIAEWIGRRIMDWNDENAPTEVGALTSATG